MRQARFSFLRSRGGEKIEPRARERPSEIEQEGSPGLVTNAAARTDAPSPPSFHLLPTSFHRSKSDPNLVSPATGRSATHSIHDKDTGDRRTQPRRRALCCHVPGPEARCASPLENRPPPRCGRRTAPHQPRRRAGRAPVTTTARPCRSEKSIPSLIFPLPGPASALSHLPGQNRAAPHPTARTPSAHLHTASRAAPCPPLSTCAASARLGSRPYLQ